MDFKSIALTTRPRLLLVNPGVLSEGESEVIKVLHFCMQVYVWKMADAHIIILGVHTYSVTIGYERNYYR